MNCPNWTKLLSIALLVGSALIATSSVGSAAPSDDVAAVRTLPPGVPFVTLQLNLCNSGFAPCYAKVNKGRAVNEARAAIIANRPDVVTLNEVCRNDVVTGLYPAMQQNFTGDHTFWDFVPAGNRAAGGQAYKCKNGDEYGIGILGRVLAGTDPATRSIKGLYPQQDTSSNEMRAWLCVATAPYVACTTHLVSTSSSIAMQQCRQLMNVEVPAIRAASGGAGVPVVVAGDLNMKFGGSPNVQSCVPAGWYRKGDGDVQHFMATNSLSFGYGTAVDLSFTDHDGWQVGVRP